MSLCLLRRRLVYIPCDDGDLPGQEALRVVEVRGDLAGAVRHGDCECRVRICVVAGTLYEENDGVFVQKQRSSQSSNPIMACAGWPSVESQASPDFGSAVSEP